MLVREIMEERIINMFNTITASDYYISNPYSSSCNKAFKRIFKSSDFLKYFYLLSNKTYERLATIANVSEDSTKNTIFVTGFRGCGKTCFMNLLNSMINSEYNLPEFKECKRIEKELLAQTVNDREDDIEKLEKRYRKSSQKICNTLQTQMHINKMEVKNENFATYLNNTLKGKSVFLNFEKGQASNDDLPFDKKFVLKIEDAVDDIIRLKGSGTSNNIFAHIINLYNRHTKIFNNTFEHKNTLLNFFEFCKSSLLDASEFNSVKRKLDEVLDCLNLEQLLFLLVLLHSALEIEEHNDDIPKLFFILDNMDIVYRHNILEESMHEYSNFIENMNSFMEMIEGSDNDKWSKIYDNITFIFAMRETTAMQIADHFIDGMDFVAKNFDISMDIDKALVVAKKFYFINKFSNEIENTDLKKTIKRVYDICTDPYIKSNIFPMFNNDYKRAITCITSLCEKNEELIDQEIRLVNTGEDYNKNGARGIIFRVIFDEFLGKRYFEKIGMEPPTNHNQEFTISRPILTLLYNLLPEFDKDEFHDDDNDRLTPETIPLRYLYSLCKPIMEKKRFIDALVGMFDLKKAPTWNHLITFDNIKRVSYQELDNYLNDIDNGIEKESEIEIRITCAGSNYIKFICTHFEFFSCRYTKNTYPLFAEKNCRYSEKYNNYNFEYVLKKVYDAVVVCCNRLKKYNSEVIKIQEENGGVPLLESDYVFRSKEDNVGRLHEERIIHWHIRYIDNYRIHIIKDIYPDKIVDMNERIISYIEKYVQLLRNPLFSNMSNVLYKELSACIKYIVDQNYNDSTTQISRKSYKQLVEEEKINGEL